MFYKGHEIQVFSLRETKFAFTVLNLFLVLICVVGIVVLGGKEKIYISTEILYELPPHEHKRGDSPLGHGIWAYGFVTIPEDMWVTSASFSIKSRPSASLRTWQNPVHNFSIEKIGIRDDRCPDKNEVLLNSGNSIFYQSNGALTLPASYAFFLPKNTKLKLGVLWHNLLAESLYDMQLMAVLGGYTADAKSKFSPIQLISLSPADCGKRTVGHISVPAYARDFSVDTFSRPYVFKQKGVIRYIGGHFHPDEGGRVFQIFLNDRVIYEFYPLSFSYKERDRHYFPAKPIHIEPADVLTMKVIYDNISPSTNHNAMATAVISFVPTQ